MMLQKIVAREPYVYLQHIKAIDRHIFYEKNKSIGL